MKPRYNRSVALLAARKICAALKPVTERLIVAGSLRRRKPTVGDVEVLFVPKFEERQVDLLHRAPFDLAAEVIERMIEAGVLEQRLSVTGAPSWGGKNKLATHVSTGIPVDLFTATEANWWNYLVCRTGPKESNMAIAAAAQAKGWKWNPYGAGFSGPMGAKHVVGSEAEVFEFVGLPYREPWERGAA